MATHKSAAVAARQRVNAHLETQIAALTDAVETGLEAVTLIERIEAERDQALEAFATRLDQAGVTFDDAVTRLRKLGKTKPEIAQLLDVAPNRIKNRRSAKAVATPAIQPPSAPTQANEH